MFPCRQHHCSALLSCLCWTVWLLQMHLVLSLLLGARVMGGEKTMTSLRSVPGTPARGLASGLEMREAVSG